MKITITEITLLKGFLFNPLLVHKVCSHVKSPSISKLIPAKFVTITVVETIALMGSVDELFS